VATRKAYLNQKARWGAGQGATRHHLVTQLVGKEVLPQEKMQETLRHLASLL
jgi:hypothetical protein